MTADIVEDPGVVEDPELSAFLARAHGWLERNAPADVSMRDPHDVSVFHDLTYDEELIILDRLCAWQRTKFEAGYGALSWPEQAHGGGLPPAYADAFKAVEAAAVSLPQHELFSVTVNLIAPTVRLFGSDQLTSLLFPELLDGSVLACQLFSEPGAGSDLANVATRAVRDEDGWVLNGHKVWTSGAQFAQWGQALVRTDRSAGKHAGLSAFMVPMDAPGIEVREIRQMSGGTSFNEVFLTDVRIPDTYLLGAKGEGWKVTRTTLGFERANASNKSDVGGRFDQLVELAQRADAERAGAQSLSALRHRDVRRQLAEVYLCEQAAEISWRREQRDRGFGKPPGASGSMRKLQWVAKLKLVSELARDLLAEKLAADDGTAGTFGWNAHVLGAPGYRIAGGSDQVQRNIVAERHLGLPPEPHAELGRRKTS